jgi:hypothetical protein
MRYRRQARCYSDAAQDENKIAFTQLTTWLFT